MSLAFGGAVGGGLGALWELADRSFRTGDQVRAELDLDYFGPLYRVEFKPEKTRSFARIRALLRAKLASRISVANEKTEAQLPSAVLDHAVRNPQSTFADTLNAIHIGASQSPAKHKTKVIGIVSTLPGEGKSVVAHNFAALLADMGLHALLIDANLRNPALTRFLAPNAEQGLIEAVCEGAPLTRTAARQADSRLDFLPAARPERAPHSSEFLASAGMKTLLEHAEEHYDYVIVDLPPMTAIVDSRAIAPLMDHFVLVVEWGRTDRNAVIRALQVDKQIRAKCLGVVLNKVDLRAMKLYEPAGSRDYYFDQCNQYHEKPITT
jgi:succinoglycan biosynthesis transport protein ExoP